MQGLKPWAEVALNQRNMGPIYPEGGQGLEQIAKEMLGELHPWKSSDFAWT